MSRDSIAGANHVYIYATVVTDDYITILMWA